MELNLILINIQTTYDLCIAKLIDYIYTQYMCQDKHIHYTIMMKCNRNYFEFKHKIEFDINKNPKNHDYVIIRYCLLTLNYNFHIFIVAIWVQ
jgi:hypothetical protein